MALNQCEALGNVNNETNINLLLLLNLEKESLLFGPQQLKIIIQYQDKADNPQTIVKEVQIVNNEHTARLSPLKTSFSNTLQAFEGDLVQEKERLQHERSEITGGAKAKSRPNSASMSGGRSNVFQVVEPSKIPRARGTSNTTPLLAKPKPMMNSDSNNDIVTLTIEKESGPSSKTFNRKPHDPIDDKVQVRLDRRTVALDNNQIKSLPDQLDLPLARPSRSVSTGSHTSNVSHTSNGWPKPHDPISSPNSPTFTSKSLNLFSEVSKDVAPDSSPKNEMKGSSNIPIHDNDFGFLHTFDPSKDDFLNFKSSNPQSTNTTLVNPNDISLRPTLSKSDANVVTRSSRSRPVAMPALNLNNIAINNMSSINTQMDDDDDGSYESDDNQHTKQPLDTIPINNIKSNTFKLLPTALKDPRAPIPQRNRQDRLHARQDLLFNCLQRSEVSQMIVSLASSNEQGSDLIEPLIHIFDERHICLNYLNILLDEEIKNAKTTTLFRGNSFCTASIVYYLKLTGKKYLTKSLGGVIHSILYPGKKNSCEINREKFSDIIDQKKVQKKIEKNTSNLLFYCEQVLSSIKYSYSYIPVSFRHLFHNLQEKLKMQFPNDQTVLTTGPSGFIWLRYMCAAMMSPKLFGIDMPNDSPAPERYRDLTLIVKLLQNLANLVEFGQKEQFMIVCNPWIISHKQSIIQCVQQFCTLPDTEKGNISGQEHDYDVMLGSYGKVSAFINANATEIQKNLGPHSQAEMLIENSLLYSREIAH